MSENLYFERGRRILSWRELLNNHARLVNKATFRRPRRWFDIHLWMKPDEALIPRVPDGPTFEWSGLHLPISEAKHHFFVVGGIGSGKSLLLGTAMNGLLQEVARNPDARAFIYDLKCELLPQIVAMGHKPIVLDPFDKRGVAIDLAADIQTPADAQQLAAALVPTGEEGHDTFWVNATRLVLAAVIESMAHFYPGRWSLARVLRTMRSPEAISELLERRVHTAHIWRNCRGEARTEANLMASFTSFLQRFEVIAALWEKTKTKISIREWASTGGGILLAPNHPRYREVLAPIHRLLLNIIADESLSLPDSNQRKTFIMLDEFRGIGRIDSLYALANEGRSKGVCLFVGTQSVEGVHEVYGTELGNELMGQLRSKVFLRNDSQVTAKWIEDHIGQVQYIVESISRTWTSSKNDFSRGATTNISRRRESLILASEIMKLAPPGPGGHFTLLNDLPCLGGVFFTHYRFEDLIARIPILTTKVAAFIERPKKDQLLGDEGEAALPKSGTKLPKLSTSPKELTSGGEMDLLKELERLESEESKGKKASGNA